MPRSIVWDPINEAEHAKRYPERPLLREAVEFDWENAVVGDASPDLYGRPRKKALGSYKGRAHVIIYAELRTEAYSVISFRRAKRKEKL